ncbi:MAG: methionine--tRNA ligase [Candidatus Norongarragalinales archaeon]
MAKKFFVTTPIYYVNDVPSIGHAYSTIAADALARFHRLRGDEVFFLTGLDENSEKTVQAAKKLGITDFQRYVDEMAVKWKRAWNALGISNDGFIRTTEPRHAKIVSEFFMKVYEKGDVYKGRYEGLYCDGCEAFVFESDLVEGKCPLHRVEPKRIIEENYFFKLSKYEGEILEFIERNPGFIQPESRKHEIENFVKAGLKDVSISRPNKEWGIPLPIDAKHKFWVWFDALLNYVSGAPPGAWPADVHVVGKDIQRFHCVIWPAMLFSAGYALPKKVFSHGFLTVNGQKMSKSLGNAIDPVWLSEKYSVDALRYYLFREISFGEDGDFSEKKLVERHDSELANAFGNFAYRSLSFIHSKTDSLIPEIASASLTPADEEFKKKTEELAGVVAAEFEACELNNAVDAAMRFADECNRYFNARAPWALFKESGAKPVEARNVLALSAQASYALALALAPITPNASKRVFNCFGVAAPRWGDLTPAQSGCRIGKPEVIAPKLALDEKK